MSENHISYTTGSLILKPSYFLKIIIWDCLHIRLKIPHLCIKLNLEELLTHFYKFTILVLIIKNTNGTTGAFPKSSNITRLLLFSIFKEQHRPLLATLVSRNQLTPAASWGKSLCKLMLRPLHRKTTLKIAHTLNSSKWNKSYWLTEPNDDLHYSCLNAQRTICF